MLSSFLWNQKSNVLSNMPSLAKQKHARGLRNTSG